MKQIQLTFIVLTLFANIEMGNAQTITEDSTIKNGTVNYAIPDAPAFKIISSDPSNIVRPTSSREVTAGLTDFLLNGSFLPKGFFTEFSPGALAMEDLTIKAYQGSPWKRFLYQTRFSLASRSEDTSSHQTFSSFGLRFTLIDHADPLMDTAFINSIDNIILEDLQELAEPNSPPTDSVSEWSPEKSNDNLKILREKKEKESWNDDILETGVAFRYITADSVAKNARIDRDQIWITGGLGFGKNSQLLLSLIPFLTRSIASSKMDSIETSLASRFYLGTNHAKVSIEVQGTAHAQNPMGLTEQGNPWQLDGLLQLGGEFYIAGNLWIDFSIGGTRNLTTGQSNNTISSVKLKWGNPPTSF